MFNRKKTADKSAKLQDLQRKLDVVVVPRQPSAMQPSPSKFASIDAARQQLKVVATTQAGVAKELAEGAGDTKAVSDFNAIGSDKKRFEQATKFAAALAKVKGVHDSYADLEDYAKAGLTKAKDDEKHGSPTTPGVGEWTKLTNEINSQRASLRENGLPTGYTVAAEPWAASLITELAPFTQGTDLADNARLRKDVKDKAPTDADKQAAQKAGQDLQDAQRDYQVRSAGRTSVFFDSGRNGVPMSHDDMDKAAQANARLAELGSNILNSGGSYKQVQELMKASGLSEEEWPPQLVQSVQAWRKTQRALNEERVRNLFKDAPMFDVTIDGKTVDAGAATVSMLSQLTAAGGELSEALREMREAAQKAQEEAQRTGDGVSGGADAARNTGSSAAGSTGTTSDAASSAADVAQQAATAGAWVNGIASGLDGIASLVRLLTAAKEFYEAATDDELPNKERGLKLLGAGIDALGAAALVAKDGMQMAKDWGGPAVQEVMKKVLPGLNIAVASIELAKSAKDLAESVDGLNKASAVKRDALASFAGDDGDEAAVNVFSNDKRAAKIKVAKDSVETGANTVELAGAIATTAGGAHGAVAGAALTITSGTIKLGAKVIFAGIDLAAAKKAMKTLKEAQAGNYQAQVEVFDQSNFYAKMYLAIMVKENNPMAKKYLVNQGLEEDDLDKPTSLAILRDQMLEASDQSNDLEADDTIMGKMVSMGGNAVDKIKGLTVEDITKGTAAFVLAGGVLAPVTLTLADFTQKALTPAYDPKATYDFGTFVYPGAGTWPAVWEATKKLHVANGLIKTASGIGGELGKAAAADKAVGPTARFPNDEAKRKALIDAIRAMEKLIAFTVSVRLEAFQSSTLPKKIPHEQAYKTMAQLRLSANAVIGAYWKSYDNTPQGQQAWKPTPITPITVAAWKAFWAEGGEKAGFPDDDVGVEKAIGEADKIKGNYDKAKGKEKRKLALEYVAALDDVNDAVLDALSVPEVGRRDTVRTAVNDFMKELNKARRTIDEELASPDQGPAPTWANPAKPFDKIKVAEYSGEWGKLWSYAKDEGFAAGSDDCGLGDAVKEFQTNHAGSKDPDADVKARMKAIRALQVSAGRVKKHAIEFARKQRYAAEPLKAYVETVQAEVLRITKDEADLDAMRADGVTFTDKPTKDPKYLSSQDWRRVVGDAVEKGAVLESKTASDKLTNALQNQKKKRKEYEAADTKTAKSDSRGKKMRKVADAYEEAMHVTVGAVAMTLGLKQYDRNKKMSGYLNGITKATETALHDTKLKGFVDGTSSLPTTEKFLPAKLDAKDWSDKKHKAIKYGVISSGDTGVGEAIEEYAKTTDAQEKKAKGAALVTLLEQMQEASKNKAWKDYVDGMVKAVP